MANEKGSSLQSLLSQLTKQLTRSPKATPLVTQQTGALFHTQSQQVQSCIRMLEQPSQQLAARNPLVFADRLPLQARVAAQGLAGAYSHMAAERLFEQPEITFYENFEQVPMALEQGQAEYGILPFENSSVGTVADITQYIYQHHCYINTMITVKIDHCLCVRPGTQREKITAVLSHPQALLQCRQTLEEMKLSPKEAKNTAIAAQTVSQSEQPLACLCSARSAQLYGLEVLRRDMQDVTENYTRFVCISRQAIIFPQADTISIALSFPNRPGALSQLLTQFMIFHLDLTRIQSMPLAGPDFPVRFHLDFTGQVSNPEVENLLGHLYDNYKDFQFLGNYYQVK